MNVCIKCQNCAKALETYNTMRQSGCYPNVVTYNTLIEYVPDPVQTACICTPCIFSCCIAGSWTVLVVIWWTW